MSSVCKFGGSACAACTVGLQAASKNKNKARPAVDFGLWDWLKNYPGKRPQTVCSEDSKGKGVKDLKSPVAAS